MLRAQESATRSIARANVQDLMRYQDFGGTTRDRALAAQWISQWVPEAAPDRLLVAPGIHSALHALTSLLVNAGQSLCVEPLVYPGIKAIATQLGTRLHPLAMDEQGLIPDSFEAACKSTPVGALYLCPNLHNPTTASLPIRRREQLADIALRHSVPIIEDDAYGMLPTAAPPPLIEFAPELTYYITGLSKWFGAGVRTAHVLAPTVATHQRLAGALRATTVMASPFINHVVSDWFEHGNSDEVLAAIREECQWRSEIIRTYLANYEVRVHPCGFHAWLPLQTQTTRHSSASEIASRLRSLGVAAVAGSAFSTDRDPPEGLRLCLGGSLTRDDCSRALLAVREALESFDEDVG